MMTIIVFHLHTSCLLAVCFFMFSPSYTKWTHALSVIPALSAFSSCCEINAACVSVCSTPLSVSLLLVYLCSLVNTQCWLRFKTSRLLQSIDNQKISQDHIKIFAHVMESSAKDLLFPVLYAGTCLTHRLLGIWLTKFKDGFHLW